MTNRNPVPYDESRKGLAFMTEMIKRLRLVWLLFEDKAVPFWTKLIVPLAFLYLISPVDFIPAAIFPVVGGLDDLGVILLGIALFLKLAPQDIVQHYRDQLEYGDLYSDDIIDMETTYPENEGDYFNQLKSGDRDDDDIVDATYRSPDEE